MQDVKGTAMPVPAADATTDAVQRNDAPACAPVAGSPVGLTCRQICAHPGRIIFAPLSSHNVMSALQNQNG